MTASLSFTSISIELFPLQTIGGDVGDSDDDYDVGDSDDDYDVGDNDDDYDVGDGDDAKHLLRQFKQNSQ